MADETFYKRLTRLFRSGPAIRRRIKGQDYKEFYDNSVMQSNLGYYNASSFKREASPFSIMGAYGILDRMSRYAEFAEMEFTAEIAGALDLYADESCSSDENGKAFHIYSDNAQIQRSLEELFYEVANIEFDGRRWYRNLVKNGDFFVYVEVVPDHGVVKLEPIPVDQIDRDEGFDAQDPYAVRFKLLSRGGKYLENWQILHFRILANDAFLPFGTSFLESARRPWRQLIMMEDAMLIYRIVRSPERRVFYIDVSAVPSNDIGTYMEAVKETIRGTNVVDKITGRQDIRYNPVSVDDDYFLPSKPNSQTKIESLAGGQHVSATEDVEYIQKKLIAALKVPRAYLTFDESLSCFVPETEISLLDGRNLSMTNIKTELDSGKELWTYSINTETKELVPGKIVDAFLAKTAEELVEVALDNGKTFVCTPEHKWMSRDGEYVQAKDLVSGTSLMPLYKRITGKDTGKRNLMGYEEVYNPGKNKWEYTHSLVDRTVNVHKVKDRRVIHHVDFNKLNNSPDNLVEMNFHDHRKLHQDALETTRKKAMAGGKYRGMNNGKAKKCFALIKHLYNFENLIDWCKTNQPKGRKEIFKNYGLGEVWFDRLLDENSITYKEFSSKFMSVGYYLCRKGTGKVPVTCTNCGVVFAKSPCLAKSKKHFCSMSCRHTKPELNHKVVSVKFLSEKREVWDITVDKYHNFALANGTIVKNSKATLSQEDIRFSRTIANLQKIVIAEMNKLAIIHLFAKGFDGEDLLDFEIRFSNPSTVAVQQKLQLLSTRVEIASKAWELSKETGMMDMEYIQRDILGFRMDDIVKMRLGSQQDQIRMAELRALSERKPSTNKDEESVVDPFNASNYGVPSSQSVTQTPEPTTAPGTAPVRLPAGEGQNVSRLSVAPGKAPIKANATPNLDAARRSSKRRITTGANALAMPNFKKMLDANNRYAKDVFDMEFLRNPLQEIMLGEYQERNIPPGINKDLRTTLLKLSEHFKKEKQVVDLEFVADAEIEQNDGMFLIERELRDLEK